MVGKYFFIDEELDRELKKRSKDSGVPQAEIIRRAIRRLLSAV